jgi:hypothetical protein
MIIIGCDYHPGFQHWLLALLVAVSHAFMKSLAGAGDPPLPSEVTNGM